MPPRIFITDPATGDLVEVVPPAQPDDTAIGQARRDRAGDDLIGIGKSLIDHTFKIEEFINTPTDEGGSKMFGKKAPAPEKEKLMTADEVAAAIGTTRPDLVEMIRGAQFPRGRSPLDDDGGPVGWPPDAVAAWVEVRDRAAAEAAAARALKDSETEDQKRARLGLPDKNAVCSLGRKCFGMGATCRRCQELQIDEAARECLAQARAEAVQDQAPETPVVVSE